jgi:phage N-6-adenine-methyltransferase
MRSPPLAKARPNRKMPEQKPGRSKQDYETPDDFLNAIKRRWSFDEFYWDLAANEANAKAPNYFSLRQDSLAQDWANIRGKAWLNPPYANIEPWARKCAQTIDQLEELQLEIFLLVPAGVGANWFARWVHGKAAVFFLNGRLKFVGETQYYPKDSLLCLFGVLPGYAVWRWR